MVYTTFTGSKYNPDTTLATLKKLVIADIAAAVEDGTLPARLEYVVTVKTEHGMNLNVQIRGLTNAEIFTADPATSHDFKNRREAIELRGVVMKIINTYNHTVEELETDYMQRHLWADVTLEDERGRKYRQQAERLAKERRLLRATLVKFGFTDFKVKETGRRSGTPCFYTHLNLTAIDKTAALEAAGLYVRVGQNNILVLTGEIA